MVSLAGTGAGGKRHIAKEIYYADDPLWPRRRNGGRKISGREGYHFLARNFKRTHGEIDLIMEDGETLVFIETSRAAQTVAMENQRKRDALQAAAHPPYAAKASRAAAI